MLVLNKTINILLLGAGNIGSRHLQGLAKVKYKLSIFVVEPNTSSRDLALDRYNEVACNDSLPHEISFFPNISDLNNTGVGKFCIAIDTTLADVRAKNLRIVLSLFEVQYFILEKVTFQSEEEFTTSINRIADAGTRAWVNCPRRYWGGYIFLRPLVLENLSECGAIHISVNGPDFGLACNSVHFIDLFAYLFGISKLDYDVRLNVSGNIKKIRQGKFIEFCGSIEGSISGQVLNHDTTVNGQYTIRSVEAMGSPLLICLRSNKFNIFVNENLGKIFSSLSSDNWNFRITNLDAVFQSSLTNIIVEQLIDYGFCDLAPLTNSESYHLPLLDTITDYLSSTSGRPLKRCPIT